MKVQVTQEHIMRGVRVSASHCPIALALTEACEKPYDVLSGIYYPVGTDDVAQVRKLPDVARAFVRDFDYGRQVEPFEFEAECT